MTLTLDTAAGTLAALRESRRVEAAEQAFQLELAVAYADQHPAESVELDAAVYGREEPPG